MIDGDTIVVTENGVTERVRLLCIDTPEKGQPGFNEATEFLRNRIEGRDIELERDPKHDNKDRYGRLLRYVHCNGKLVNAEIIEAGHSTYWTKYGGSSIHEAELKR